MPRKIAVVGGGPGGLLFALLHRRRHPEDTVVVHERNRADDTFGFGVVFSDATLRGINAVDPVLQDALDAHGRRWDRIEVRAKGERHHVPGNGMSAIARRQLLLTLQERARAAGADLRFESPVGSLSELSDYDVVVAADGANSRLRTELEDEIGPTYEEATAKFIWFGTTYEFNGLTFVHEPTEHGLFAVHAYPVGDNLSTFLVETDGETWRRAGLDEFDTTSPPGPSDEKSREFLEQLFAKQIDGHPLVVNNSRWSSFRTRRARRWSSGNVALIGDAVHTAHFSVGSGTKMAMEDAIALVDALDEHPDDVSAAFAAYEDVARPPVEKIQASARPSLSWWERFGMYHDQLEPAQLTFHFMARAMSAQRMRRRADTFVEDTLADWRARHDGTDPLETPLRIGTTVLPGRTLEMSADGGALRSGDHTVPVLTTPPTADGSADAVWVLAVDAPTEEAAVPAVVAEARQAVRADGSNGPAAVVVRGEATLPVRLVAEDLRFDGAVPVLVADVPDEDAALTHVLAGRADAVAMTVA
ncbi:FAD-dependent monooxygenase [Georgenia sp. Z1491]|uniref:FAD-dependent monooxygenase n=1 Tax=Georgenia sp. Z1491 TaxID=3416707 RepID=UPI003CE79D94